MSAASLGYLLAAAALLCFSVAILATKKASAQVPLSLGFLVATATNVVCAGVALTLQLAVQDSSLTWDGRAFLYFVAAGVLATYLGRWFFYESVLLFGPAKASVFQVSNPLFTAVIAWLWLGERLDPHIFAAMFVAVVGLLVIATQPLDRRRADGTAPATKAPSTDATGQLPLMRRLMGSILFLGTGSSLAYGASNVLRAAAVRDWHEPVLGGLLGAGSGLLMYLITTPRKREIWLRLQQADRNGLWLYVLIGASTIAGQVLTIGAMRYIPAAVAMLVTLCTPLVVIPLSRLIYRQDAALTPSLLAGAALTMAGMAVVVLR